MRDMIKELHIMLPVEEITESFIQQLGEAVRQSSGKAVLYINLFDKDEQVALNMYSRKYHIEITSELTDFLNEREIKYTVS